MSNTKHNVVVIGAGAVGYDGRGSCPLAVKRGKPARGFVSWLFGGTCPAGLAWMLRGREWLAGSGGLIAP